MKNFYSGFIVLLLSGALSAQTTFNYTGTVQSYTVPICVSSITVDVYGASGGSNNSNPGGSGGRVQATVPVTPGEVLHIFVGATGANTQGSHPGVYNGGGGVFSYSSGGTAGTGGGGTDIRRSPYTTADRLVVAGGGGGGGYQTTTGGHGGGLIAQNGTPFPSWPSSGGGAGTQSSGGAQGVACCSCPTYTTAGTLAQGGNGAGDGAGGGGGGGGYYGGGGSCFGGGGGGSSYTHATVTGVVHTQGVRIGNGQVIISNSATVLTSPTGFTGSANVCAGASGNYSINAVAGATGYTWSVPAGSTINSGQGTTTINVTFGTTSGNISVTADDACGSSPPSTQAITVNAAPVVALGADVAQCGGTVSLDAGNAGSTYLWSNSSTSQMINVSSSGIYSVTVTNASGCIDRDTIQVLIHPLPVVALGTDVTQCGGSVVLNAGNAGSTHLWSNSSTTQMITVSASGIYSVIVSDINGCNGMDTVAVTINPVPVVTLGADVTQCGGSVMLDAGNAGSTHLWSTSGTTQMITVSASGAYSVIVSDINGCNGMDTVSVTINPIPVVTAAATNTTPCLADGAVTLTGSPSGGTWTGPGVSGNSFDPSVAGVGTHQLVYTYIDGATTCTDTAQVSIVVDICTNIVSENTAGAVNIFPNPVADQLQVQSDETLISYVIVDVTGRAVVAGSFATGQPKQIDVTMLPAGTYLLQTTTAAGEVRTAQFVKK